MLTSTRTPPETIKTARAMRSNRNEAQLCATSRQQRFGRLLVRGTFPLLVMPASCSGNLAAAPPNGSATDAATELDAAQERPPDDGDAGGHDSGPGDAPESDGLGDEPATPEDAGDASNECPVVEGGCTPGCTGAYGWGFDIQLQCFTTPALLTCYPQFALVPAQSLAAEAPDGTCWLVHSLVYELLVAGWKQASDPLCLHAALDGPWCNGPDATPLGDSCAALAHSASTSGKCSECVSSDGFIACEDEFWASLEETPPCESAIACMRWACFSHLDLTTVNTCSCFAGCLAAQPPECSNDWTEFFQCPVQACADSCG